MKEAEKIENSDNTIILNKNDKTNLEDSEFQKRLDQKIMEKFGKKYEQKKRVPKSAKLI